MDDSLILSVSGLRGIIGQSLTPEVAMRYAAACHVSTDSDAPFVITRDGRRSGALLTDAICAMFNALGRDTIDAGIAATPTTGILIRQHRAAGGIQISASHNPAQYNGLKFFSSHGRIVPREFGEKVIARFHDGEQIGTYMPFDRLGVKTRLIDTTSFHLQKILNTVNVDLIRDCHFRVLLDSNHGAGSLLGKQLLEQLGCEVIHCGASPDGLFEHIPEPIMENLAEVADLVRLSKVDIGFCQDPDADRLAVIDANGHYLGEEYTLALCVQNRLEKLAAKEAETTFTEDAPLVTNCSTSRMTADIAKKFHRECYFSPVGEANVVDLMIEKEAVFGGEGNGGPIDPAVGLVRDSFVGMANILEAMARKKKSPDELIDELPHYYIIKRKIPWPLDKVPGLLDRLKQKYENEPIECQDGLRIDRQEGWVLVRGSNTEPIVRVIAEANSPEKANAFCDELEQAIEQ